MIAANTLLKILIGFALALIVLIAMALYIEKTKNLNFHVGLLIGSIILIVIIKKDKYLK